VLLSFNCFYPRQYYCEVVHILSPTKRAFNKQLLNLIRVINFQGLKDRIYLCESIIFPHCNGCNKNFLLLGKFLFQTYFVFCLTGLRRMLEDDFLNDLTTCGEKNLESLMWRWKVGFNMEKFTMIFNNCQEKFEAYSMIV